MIPARDFFLDTFTTAIEPTEVLTEIRIPRPARAVGRRLREARAPGRRLRDRRRRRPAPRSATTAGSRDAGIGLTAVAETPFAATDAEAVCSGQRPSEELFRRAAQAAAAQSRPVADVRGPADYKRAMVAEMTARALRARRRARDSATREEDRR